VPQGIDFGHFGLELGMVFALLSRIGLRPGSNGVLKGSGSNPGLSHSLGYENLKRCVRPVNGTVVVFLEVLIFDMMFILPTR